MGHTTRSVAIIRELIKDGIQVTVRNSNMGYLNKSLPNINTISGTTDVGPTIEKNGISINENKTLENIGKWIQLALTSGGALYSGSALKKMAQNDIGDNGFNDLFKSIIKGIKWIVDKAY